MHVFERDKWHSTRISTSAHRIGVDPILPATAGRKAGTVEYDAVLETAVASFVGAIIHCDGQSRAVVHRGVPCRYVV